MTVASRGLTKPHGDQLRFGRAIELAGRGRFLAFLALQSQFKSFRNQALAKILYGLHAAIKRIGNLDIRPSWPISIRLEQNLSATKLLRRSFEIFDDLLTNTSLLIRQAYNEFLVHGKPPCDRKLPVKPQNQQPQFLALMGH